ncbi:MAG: hypothetical protein R2851_02065 [Caldilineaceae bacterium]
MAQDPQIRARRLRLLRALDCGGHRRDPHGDSQPSTSSAIPWWSTCRLTAWPADRLVAATLERCCPTEQIDRTLVIETIRDRHPRPLLTLLDTIDAPVCA